jgi:hypothetical protein
MKDAILCDVDGTVALMMGKRSPFEYEKAFKDEPNHPVISTVLALKESYGCELIMLSARENVVFNSDVKCMRGEFSSSYDLTERWLDIYIGDQNYDKLILRDKDDHRKDCYVKYDIYNNHIKGNWNVLCVFDDRNQVVDMWRNALGLQCFQVADGNF